MKRINLYILAMLLCLPLIKTQAQGEKMDNVKLQASDIKKAGNDVLIHMDINIDDLELSSQEMLIITPVIKSRDIYQSKELRPIIISGKKREKAVERAMYFDDYKFEQEPKYSIRRHNNQNQSVIYNDTIPYEAWLRNADMHYKGEIVGCACDSTLDERRMVAMLPPAFEPQYMFTFIIPEPEPVKARSEKHEAHLNFVVNRYELLRNYKNNTEILDEVDEIVHEIRSDNNLEVKEFHVTGYASPEGNFDSNMILSRNRANSFVQYMQQTYNVDPRNIVVDWKGEDWEGLRNVVATLDIPEKYDVLDILDNEDNITLRKRKLQQLNGGTTYRMLLNTYYPPLRRNDYTISYVARPFDVEEAREIIKTKPHHLSQNEMYLVANTYPRESDEFKEVFAIAYKSYPDDPISIVNVCVTELENGNYDYVIEKLENIDLPHALNNLGVAYVYKNNYEKAEDCFKRAASANLEEARHNSEQLALWLDDQY